MHARTLGAILGTMVVCGCGAATPSHGSQQPQSVFLSAVQRATTGSVTVRGTLDETISGTGSFATVGSQQVTASLDLTSASATSGSGSLTLAYNGNSVTAEVVYVSGTSYVSTDNGTTWKSVSMGAGGCGGGVNQPLQYLESVGAVTGTGTTTYQGSTVQAFHAQLNGPKVLAVVRCALSNSSSSNPELSTIIGAMSITSGSVDADINNHGQLVHDSLSLTASVDAAAIQPGATGALNLSETGQFDFSNYGKTVTVTAPPNA